MVYFILFLAGAAAASSALIIWYMDQIGRLRRDKRALTQWHEQLKSDASGLAAQSAEVQRKVREHEAAATAFDARQVTYDNLLGENTGLKQDLFNLSVQLRKTERDQAAINRRQEEITRKMEELAQRYLDENVAWLAAKLTPNNFATSKQRLLKVVEACRAIGFAIPEEKETSLVEDLRKGYEDAVRREFARQEQARIKAQIREEERLAREAQKRIDDAERERAAIAAALQAALKATKDEHAAEVESLRAKLKEAEEKAQRAISQAQLTKAGHVYVLSNIGAFGGGVYKIGMTRRLEPLDRVRELGDASVPFPFDVHMMISCNDAPALENALHREFHKQRMNKVNFRKEYFRVDLQAILDVVASQHGQVDYILEPEASEYREGLNMTDEDYEFIEHVMEPLLADADGSPGED